LPNGFQGTRHPLRGHIGHDGHRWAIGGPSKDQKREVAAAAQTLFGTAIDASQVIGEALERATPELNFTAPPVVKALADAINSETPAPGVQIDSSSHLTCLVRA